MTTAPPRPTDIAPVRPGLLEPGGASLDAMRAAVLRWWGLDGDSEARPVDPPGGTRTVVAVAGDPFAEHARRYAALTGAELRVAGDTSALASGAALPETGAAVVVARAGRLPFDLLELVAERAAERPGLRVGYLTAPDDRSLDLVVRKAVLTLAGGAGHTGRGYVDAFRGDNGLARPGAAAFERGLRSAEVLAAEHRALLVGGHGDGLHVRLPDATVCGLVGLVETSGGRPVRGGCRRTPFASCKKDTGGGMPVFPAADLRAEFLLLLSCKSFVTTEQVYPSNASMLLSAATGYAGAIVGVTRQIAFDDEAVAAVDALLQAGSTAGDLVAVLNEQQLRRHGVPCHALLGDPDARFAVPDAPPVRLGHHGATRWTRSRPVAVRPPRGAGYLLHERSRTHVLAAGLVAEPARDASGELGETVALLLDARRRLADGEALERVAASYARSLGAYDGELTALLGRVAAARGAVADEVWAGLGVCAADTRHRTTWHPQLDPARVAARMTQWTVELAELVAEWFVHEEVRGRYVADHFIPSLAAHRVPGPAYVLPETCPSCHGRLTANDYDGAALGLSPRTAVMCAACGPTATYGTLRADLAIGGDPRPGGRVVATVTVEHPALTHGTPVGVALQVKPRSKVNPPVTARELFAPGTRSATFEIALPEGAACDLWSARCGVTSDGEVAFARRTFAPLAVD